MAKKKKGNNKKKKNDPNKQEAQPHQPSEKPEEANDDNAASIETENETPRTDNTEEAPTAAPEAGTAEEKKGDDNVTPLTAEEKTDPTAVDEEPAMVESAPVEKTDTTPEPTERDDAPIEQKEPQPSSPAVEASTTDLPMKEAVLADQEITSTEWEEDGPSDFAAETIGPPVQSGDTMPVAKETAEIPKEESPDSQVDEEQAKKGPSPSIPGVLDNSPSDEMGPVETPEPTMNAESESRDERIKHKCIEEKTVEPTPSQDTINASNAESQTKEVKFSQLEKPKKKAASQGLTFAAAFGNPASKPAPIDTERSATKPRNENPTPTGLTFAQAFSDKPPPPISPLVTPASVSGDAQSTPGIDPLPSTKSTNSSHSALSASKNRKVSDRMSKYMEEVHHEPLPGDAIPIKKKIPEPSPANSVSYSSQGTPLSAQSIREKLAVTEVELAQLPNIGSVREKFESSARSSGSGAVFEFGESFRQKKRYEQLTDKEKEMEAKVAMRGFNERDLFPGKTASGEIDTSNLGKVYTFEMSANASLDLPPDGTCRVDYKKADYSAMVFVVHRTRGMLLLHIDDLKGNKKSQVPSGKILEEEFLDAAMLSGSHNVQLQIAAREAAARQLYENTGLDIRGDPDRFKPAILRLNPPVDARGVQYLKNEYDNKLYYFLQVDDNDFSPITYADTSGQTGFKLKRPSEDPGDNALTLRLHDTYGGFTFILDPGDAAKILKQDGNKAATSALQMIMNEASEGIGANSPDAKATEYSVSDSAPDDEKADRLASSSGNVRTVGEKPSGEPSSGDGLKSFHDEADLKLKSSSDTNEHTTGVSCCCGWW
jgi:hypothetical protein